ncbi:MAG: FAD-binding protein [Nitrospinae bacterium]|nr:FAD-binding protein [Nitrospinota bacterium]
MAIEKGALVEIRAVCRDVSTTPADLLLYSFDATRVKHRPDCVCWPRSTDEVAGIMKICARRKIPVTPRGAGTGFAGSSVPVEGGVVLAFARMDKILKIDPEAMYAEVEPGVVNQDLGTALSAHGLFYPPDPASLRSSTIGGNVMTGAGGPSAVKYGVTRDYVMGLTFVLPSGEVVETGVKTLKWAVGYDLTSLMVGSEGTLGIITKIRLRVVPLPKTVVTAMAVFNGRRDVVSAVAAILRSGAVPRTMEIMDSTAVKCVEEYLKAGLPVDCGGMLLIETDGGDSAAVEMEKIRAFCLSAGAREFNLAKDGREADQFRKTRRSISASLNRLRPTKINEDVVVPRNLIAELLDGLDAISKKSGLPIVTFGHAGDGNIHVNIMTDRSNEAEYAAALKVLDEVFDLVLKLGGTISGEHGVGLSKKPYVSKEMGEGAISLSKRLKRAFDPDNLLNPGKIFP